MSVIAVKVKHPKLTKPLYEDYKEFRIVIARLKSYKSSEADGLSPELHKYAGGVVKCCKYSVARRKSSSKLSQYSPMVLSWKLPLKAVRQWINRQENYTKCAKTDQDEMKCLTALEKCQRHLQWQRRKAYPIPVHAVLKGCPERCWPNDKSQPKD